LSFGSSQNYVLFHSYDQRSKFNSRLIRRNQVHYPAKLERLLHDLHFLNIPEAEGMSDADGVISGSGV
jgi:hypothetical protein